MKSQPTYRGELLPNLAKLTDDQIADRVREAAALDALLQKTITRYVKRACESQDGLGPEHTAAARAYTALLDIGLASIAAAEHRVEVQLFTCTAPVTPKPKKKGRARRG